MSELTDDEAIVLAYIHYGKPFFRDPLYSIPESSTATSGWFVNNNCGEWHPIETIRLREMEKDLSFGTRALFETLVELSQAYCAYYKVGLPDAEV